MMIFLQLKHDFFLLHLIPNLGMNNQFFQKSIRSIFLPLLELILTDGATGAAWGTSLKLQTQLLQSFTQQEKLGNCLGF